MQRTDSHIYLSSEFVKQRIHLAKTAFNGAYYSVRQHVSLLWSWDHEPSKIILEQKVDHCVHSAWIAVRESDDLAIALANLPPRVWLRQDYIRTRLVRSRSTMRASYESIEHYIVDFLPGIELNDIQEHISQADDTLVLAASDMTDHIASSN
jgi:hypothetical protein